MQNPDLITILIKLLGMSQHMYIDINLTKCYYDFITCSFLDERITERKGKNAKNY